MNHYYERLASDCKKIIEKPFCDLDIAMRAGQMARYFDERHGYGCGDQGQAG